MGARSDMPAVDIELEVPADGRVEWLVADLSLARALFEGVPAARLLARTRLASDERHLTALLEPSGNATAPWDALLRRLFGKSADDLERVKRQVARHTRAASDEGPLVASDAVVAALTYAVAATTDMDASIAEAFATDTFGTGAGAAALARTCAAYDTRLASPIADKRGPLFEACVRLATRAAAGPWPLERVLAASRQLSASELGVALVRRSNASLFPPDLAEKVARADRRMTLLERGELDVLVKRNPRELAAIIARVDVGSGPTLEAHLDSLLADLGKLLAHAGALVLALPFVEPPSEQEAPTTPQPAGVAPSWMPTDWSSPEASASLADAYERGRMTPPRLRAAVARGGEPAIDAIGAEMLQVDLHPFASAAFAELLARSGRPRDVMRLVTYFAIAPDPAVAARALSACAAPELPAVLAAWLEAMLPADGAQAPVGRDPLTSSAARLTACVTSLAPYPQLYRAVRPLLLRVSDAPPPAGVE